MASDRSLLGLQHGLRSHVTWHNPALCIRATMPSFALLLRFFGEALWQTDGQEGELGHALHAWCCGCRTLGREGAMPGEGTGAENGYGLVRRVSSVEPRDGYGKTPRLGRQNGCRGGGAWSETVKSDAAGGQRVRERQRPCGEAWPAMMGVPLVSAVRRPRGWFGGKCRLRGRGPPSQLYAEVAERRSDRERVC
jgi:hypothetical protein